MCVCAFVMVLQLLYNSTSLQFHPSSHLQPLFFYYWRASEASETLSGLTQSRFRYIYLFIYLSVYGVRETSVLARASNYVS